MKRGPFQRHVVPGGLKSGNRGLDYLIMDTQPKDRAAVARFGPHADAAEESGRYAQRIGLETPQRKRNGERSCLGSRQCFHFGF